MTTSTAVNIQAAKQELLRLGRERGYIAEHELVNAIPVGMITPTELEVFFFTIDMMEIELRLSDASANRETGRITLLTKLAGQSRELKADRKAAENNK